MYKKKGVSKLGKPAGERNALIKSQVKDLLKNGFIRTTKARGKAVVRKLDSLMSDVTDKKMKTVSEYIADSALEEKVSKMELKGKRSGFATIREIKNRPGDNSEQVLIELI